MHEDYDKHLLLHHLDDPLRILKWTLDEAGIILLPPFLSLLIESPLLGFVVSGGGYWALRQIKKRFGLGTLKHALYWYFPHNSRRFKKIPPSHIREYLA